MILATNCWTYVILTIQLYKVLIEADILRLPACNKYYAEFTTIHTGYELSSKFIYYFTKTNIKHCLALCIQFPTCKSIALTDDLSNCRLYSKRNGEDGASLMSSNGWIFIETGNNSVNVSFFIYSLPFF